MVSTTIGSTAGISTTIGSISMGSTMIGSGADITASTTELPVVVAASTIVAGSFVICTYPGQLESYWGFWVHSWSNRFCAYAAA